MGDDDGDNKRTLVWYNGGDSEERCDSDKGMAPYGDGDRRG